MSKEYRRLERIKTKDTSESGRKTPSKGVKPKISINWDQVKSLCRMQCTNAEICNHFDINVTTMRNACLDNFGVTPEEKFAEWRTGGNCSLRRKQWLLADTSAAMAIFLGKQYLNQDDDYGVHYSGTPINVINFGDGEAKPWMDETHKTERTSEDS